MNEHVAKKRAPLSETVKKAAIVGIALIILAALSVIPLPENWLVLERATLDGTGQKAMAVLILSLTGNSTRTILFGFLAAGTLLSMWITGMAVAAMLMPLGKAVQGEEGIRPLESNFGRALMISCAWGPIIGGIGTPAGCGPNPIAIGFLKEMAGIELSFLGWMKYGVPAALVLLMLFKPEFSPLKKTRKELQNEYKKLPPRWRVVAGRPHLLDVSTLAVTLPAALTSSLAFILVTSSPTNVIPYSAGYFSIKDFAKGGIAITLVSSLLVASVILAVGAASGLY